MNLDLKRKKFNIVIGADYVKNYEKKIIKLSQLGCNFATILHDCDIDINGVLKNKHYHLVVQLDDRIRAKTFLNRLCDILKCDSVNIQIEECFNFIKSIQYLIHKNDNDKYRYNEHDIISNLGDLLFTYINCEDKTLELTSDMLIEVIENTQDIIDIIKIIGIEKYNRYRNTIFDIRETLRNRKSINQIESD